MLNVTIRPIFISKSSFSLSAHQLIFGYLILYYTKIAKFLGADQPTKT